MSINTICLQNPSVLFAPWTRGVNSANNNTTPPAPATYSWPSATCTVHEEILETIRFVSKEFKELKAHLEPLQSLDLKTNFEKLKTFTDYYNEWVLKASQEQQQQTSATPAAVAPPKQRTRASTKLVRHVMHLIYNRAVYDPEKLNHYEPFSPQVYGETSFDLIDQMLQRVPLGENDVFLDLGSGVGNVVLQVAASTKCRMCYGVEKAEWPARYAERMEKEFLYWMDFFGKTHSDFKIHKGDFLSEEEFVETIGADGTSRKEIMSDYVKSIINEAKLLFVNNYAFGAEVDHQLKLRFTDMTERAMIVSSKPFCALNFRINSRNLNDFGAMLNVSEFEPISGKVSWTDKPINYYFQRIDRTELERYFEKKKTGGSSKSNNNNTNNNGNNVNKEEDNKTSSSASSSSSSSPTYSSASPSSPPKKRPSSTSSDGRHSSSSSSSCTSSKNNNNNNSSRSSSSGSTSSSDDESIATSKSSSSSNTNTNNNSESRKKKKRKKNHKLQNKSGSEQAKKLVIKSRSTNAKSASITSSKDKKAAVKRARSKSNTTIVSIAASTSSRKGGVMNASIATTSTKRSSSATAAPFDEKTLKTLETMHKNVESLSSDATPSNSCQQYNIKAMTKLTSDNCEARLLKDCKISSRVLGNTSSESSSKKQVHQQDEEPMDVDQELTMLKRELGPEVFSHIENYSKVCTMGVAKYLHRIKSQQAESVGAVRQELLAAMNTQAFLMQTIHNVEQQMQQLQKVNVALLKRTVADLTGGGGKAPVETPEQLMQCIRDTLDDNSKLAHRVEQLSGSLSQPASPGVPNSPSTVALRKIMTQLDEVSLKQQTSPSVVTTPKSACKRVAMTIDKISSNNNSDERMSGIEESTRDKKSIKTPTTTTSNKINNKSNGHNTKKRDIPPKQQQQQAPASLPNKNILESMFWPSHQNVMMTSFKIPKQQQQQQPPQADKEWDESPHQVNKPPQQQHSIADDDWDDSQQQPHASHPPNIRSLSNPTPPSFEQQHQNQQQPLSSRPASAQSGSYYFHPKKCHVRNYMMMHESGLSSLSASPPPHSSSHTAPRTHSPSLTHQHRANSNSNSPNSSYKRSFDATSHSPPPPATHFHHYHQQQQHQHFYSNNRTPPPPPLSQQRPPSYESQQQRFFGNR